MSTSLLPENRSDVSGFTLKDTLVHRYFYFRRNSSNLEVSDGGGVGGGDWGVKLMGNKLYCFRNPDAQSVLLPLALKSHVWIWG